MRILGLDYGERRIGVALCDELGITAQGLTTIHRKNRKIDTEAIAGIVKEYGVETIVLGYPLMLDGSEGIQCAKVKSFAKQLEFLLSIPVIFQDETLTTKAAEEMLRLANVKREKIKLVVDKVAAAMILQSYLDSRKVNRQPELERET